MSDNNEVIVIEQPGGQLKDQIAKTVLGALAGLFASKAVEKGYDAVKEMIKNRATDIAQ